MIEKWAHISVLYLLRHKVIKKEDIEIYEFGCHVLYNFIIDMISIIIMAILINQIPQTFFYHIAFIPLRRFTGGYHAKTHLRCFFMSTTLWIISLALVSITYTMPLLSIIIIILSFGLVWVIAPIEHENNPLSMQKRKKMKVICKIL